MERNEVNAAFEILLEEIESVANAFNEEGANALRRGDHDKAQQAIEEATRPAEFREKIKTLRTTSVCFLSFRPAQTHQFRLSYSKRMNRPNTWQLNPLSDLDDPPFRRQGDRPLNPA